MGRSKDEREEAPRRGVRGARWLLGGLALAGFILAAGASVDSNVRAGGSRDVEAYLMPRWYAARVQVTSEGSVLRATGTIDPHMAPMLKARVFWETGRGVTQKGAPMVWTGDLTRSRTFQGTFEVAPGTKKAYLTLAFEYDFPEEEILTYVKDHREDLYPDDELRRDLLETLARDHAGRKSGGVTERVDMTPSNPGPR